MLYPVDSTINTCNWLNISYLRLRCFSIITIRHDSGKIWKLKCLKSAKKHMSSKSSHQGCSVKKAALKNFVIFTGKQTCSCYFIKQRLQQGYFPVNIANFLRTPVLKNISERLLLFNSQLKISAQQENTCSNLGIKKTLSIHFRVMFYLYTS